jgi:glycerol kinase
MPSHILALDSGTTSCRAIVFDHAGSIVAVAQREFAQHFPHPGWVEHDANEIWRTQSAVAAEALVRAGVAAKDLAAIGITNQRETTLLWDRSTGEPVAPAIVWQDRRTAEMCDLLRAEGAAPLLQQKTGLVLDAYFSATKLRWLLDHVPGARARAEQGELAFGTIDSWLLWKLTGGARHFTDPTNASRTLLFDLHTGAWDDELLALFHIPRAVLPEVRPSSEIYGECTLPALRGIPIASLAGDQQAALYGQACTRPGMAKNTYGTGCFLLLHTGSAPIASRHQLVATAAACGPRGTAEMESRRGAKAQRDADGSHDLRGVAALREPSGEGRAFALEGSVFIAGAVVQWLRDGLGIIKTSADIEPLAASVPDAGGVSFVPAFAGLGAPHWDPRARGTITGLSRGSGAAHLARAALESIAFQTADVLDAMRADAPALPLTEMRADGGAAVNDLLLQFQADVIGVPVVRPAVTETTALGAAYLAGLATGFWAGEAEIASQWRAARTFDPAMEPARVAELRARWSAAVERAKG